MRFRLGSMFLLMLSILVVASVRHGLLALRERKVPGNPENTITPCASRSRLAPPASALATSAYRKQLILLMIFGSHRDHGVLSACSARRCRSGCRLASEPWHILVA